MPTVNTTRSGEMADPVQQKARRTRGESAMGQQASPGVPGTGTPQVRRNGVMGTRRGQRRASR